MKSFIIREKGNVVPQKVSLRLWDWKVLEIEKLIKRLEALQEQITRLKESEDEGGIRKLVDTLSGLLKEKEALLRATPSHNDLSQEKKSFATSADAPLAKELLFSGDAMVYFREVKQPTADELFENPLYRIGAEFGSPKLK